MDWDEGTSLDNEVEYDFMCPYCWQPITMLLDLSAGSQHYVEDCEICCNPIEIDYGVDRDGFISHFEGRKME